MRTRTAAMLIATGGLTLGLMSASASAAPAGSADSSSVAQVRNTAYIKNARNITGTPPRGTDKAVCSWVHDNRARTLGKACFEKHGDRFWVKDMRADGKPVYMRAIYLQNWQTMFDCRNFKGKAAGWTRCEFSRQMKENRKIQFTPLVYKGNYIEFDGSTATVQN